MISSSSQRRGWSGSLLTFVAIGLTVFALLSLIGGLLAPSASADDDGLHAPTQNMEDPSEWESCGDNCIVPEFICPPGYSGPTSGSAPSCEATGKTFVSEPDVQPFDTIECAEGEYVAFDIALTAESVLWNGPPIDSQFCTAPTAELLFGHGISCPAGYTLAQDFGPMGDYPLEPTADEIDALQAEEEASAVAPMLPAPTPVPAMPTDIPDELLAGDFPTCVAADGSEIGATVRGILEPAPYEPVCADDDARLYSTPSGIVCRSASGDTLPTVAMIEAPVCVEGEIEVGTGPYTICVDSLSPAFPVCPVGYIQYANSPDATTICTNDEQILGDVIVALPPMIPSGCGVACQSAIAQAQDAAEDAADAAADERYASYPSCPAFALLADGTCANIITSSDLGATTGSGGTIGNPAPVATAIPVAPAIVYPITAPVITAPAGTSPIITHAANYGFGNSLPAVTGITATKATTAKLAHTGTETNAFLYAALSMVAAGAVAMGSRRRQTLNKQ